MGRWSFDFEATDRRRWPALHGRVVVEAAGYIEALSVAHDMVGGLGQIKAKERWSFWLPKVEMVTALWCVDWPE